MNHAGEILGENHRQALRLLDDLANPEARTDDVRAGLLERVRLTLREHAVIEEELVHPALGEVAGKGGDRELLELLATVCRDHRAAVQLVLTVLERVTRGPVTSPDRTASSTTPVACRADDAEAKLFEAARRVASQLDLSALDRPRVRTGTTRR